ncbi:MAG: hypothetical protein K2X35_09460 [Bryobacteraceae bacterium]|nr:hypothetical protein [Bryobacteraceae bacterium]
MTRAYLLLTLGGPQDARDLYRERGLVCAGCGAANGGQTVWTLPGLCAECALRVEAVTASAPRTQPQQQALLDVSGFPD